MAAASRPKFSQLRDIESIFAVKLSELNADERLGLLVRYLRDVEQLRDIDASEFGSFRSVLNGYPEQAIYAGQLIAEAGLQNTIGRMNDIVQFSSLKASVYIDKYRENPAKSDFLIFLSWFEFVSLEMISFLSGRTSQDLLGMVDEFVADSICDLIGTMGEYVRLNDIVRDYVLRGSLEIPPLYASALKVISKEIFSSGDFSEYDYSEKYAAVRVSLLEGAPVPDKLLIPAHFLGAISQKYKTRKYSDVIDLADRILVSDNYEPYILAQVRHYLCMSLARTRSQRFMAEVQKIVGNEHSYVLGFYYRLTGRYREALERQERAIADGRWEENAKREMVLIYNIIEDYDRAFSMARDSYIGNKSNPINIQAYFEVLLNLPRTDENIAEIEATIETVSKINSERAQEIGICMRGRYAFHVKQNAEQAYAILDEGVARFMKSPYPLIAKLDVAVNRKDHTVIRDCLSAFKASQSAEHYAKAQIVKAEVMLMALQGEKGKALARIDGDLSFIHNVAQQRFRAKVLAV